MANPFSQSYLCFLVQYRYQNGKIWQMTLNILNGHKFYQKAVKNTKWPQNIPTATIKRPSKIYPKVELLVWK
jgi:hypothetical protein